MTNSHDLPVTIGSLAEPCAPRTGRLRNWGRWGADNQKGAVNLITPERSGPRRPR
jgi:hypothetical protein